MDNNKRIVVLGATSAIAQATLKLFANAGYDCCLVARNTDKLSMVADDLLIRGAKSAVLVEADLSDCEKHSEVFSTIATVFGDFDSVLIAYGTISEQKACEKNYLSTYAELNINCLSVISLLTVIANRFEEQEQGQIAVISSVAGDRGRQSNYIYGTAKGALSIFLQGLRNRLCKKNINVLTIKPGFVDTPMTKDFNKGLLWASPDKIAEGIYDAMNKRRDVVYLPWFWQWIMLIIKLIPERIFKKLNL
jgi:short-subunit dehydrogenase